MMIDDNDDVRGGYGVQFCVYLEGLERSKSGGEEMGSVQTCALWGKITATVVCAENRVPHLTNTSHPLYTLKGQMEYRKLILDFVC